MPPLQLLVKPASGLCNMRCEYCFYTDIAGKRETASYGRMTDAVLEKMIEKALSYAEGSCTFTFQGGEPSLAGLSYFEKVVKLQDKYNINKIRIQNAIQTNGTAMGIEGREKCEEWCHFLAEHDFLTGLSLDGIKATHDCYRKDAEGKETFFRIMDMAAMFDRFGVEYNILTVVNAKTAPKIRKIYEFYRKNGFKYQQYIACLDPVFEKQGQQEYSLTPEIYGNFLKELFDLWYIDLQWGRQPYIRQFENYVAVLMGRQPESCEQKGICSVQHVVEADGSVYPCDFYVLDEYRLGNLTDCGFEEIAEKRKEIKFIENSLNHDEECRQCAFFPLCRGGCARHRVKDMAREGNRNYFCQSYKMFFEHSLDRLRDIAGKLKNR